MSRAAKAVPSPGAPDIAEQIVRLPARTRDGVEVKARVIRWWQGDEEREGATLDYYIVESLLADLRAIAPASAA